MSQALLKQGQELHKQGKLQEARVIYQQILQENPDDFEALFSIGLLAKQIGSKAVAEKMFRRALELQPRFQHARIALLSLLLDLKKFAETETEARIVLKAEPKNTEALHALGSALWHLGHATEAEPIFERLVKLVPQSHSFWHALATVQEGLGKFTQSCASYEKSIALNPGPQASLSYLQLGKVKGYHKGDTRIAAMETLLSQPNIPQKSRMELHFALGEAYHTLKQYDKAFAHYLEANRLQRTTYGNWNIGVARQEFANMHETMGKHLPDTDLSLGCNDDTPIFILGMPRSGTTLVEQILSSHPDVFGAGETRHLAETIQYGASKNPQNSFNTNELSAEDRKHYGEYYVRLLRKDAPADARYITDKMPNNFVYIGIIALLLPKARIVHCVRDPVDTCLSVFRQHFTDTQPHSSDLSELGEYYRMYRELMALWHKVLPGRIYDIRYETLLDNFEPEVRKLLKYCGLSWNDKVLEFHKTERDVRTASATQVRKPLYRSSVALWKPYEPYLGPLIKALGDCTATP